MTSFLEEALPHTKASLSMQDKLTISRSSESAKSLSKKYKATEQCIYQIKRIGSQVYQERVNRGGSSLKRERNANSERRGAERKVQEELERLWSEHLSKTKSVLFELMDKEGVFRSDSGKPLSNKSKERIYKKFKYSFGWSWQRFGRKRCIAPTDLTARITAWSLHEEFL